ncbi:MAG TPA: thiamine pyrophosphate-dependent enzyme [Myxococcaceae bacterium]
MSLERARQSVQRLLDLAVKENLEPPPPSAAGRPLPPAQALELFESQLLCRLVDVESHELRARNQGYYTICSAGHEGNAALGRLTRLTDPALLHYRSGALSLERARQREGHDGVMDLLLSLAASADDPISGGRHKVFGSVPLGVLPQTSTISSHLPRAVGMAVAIDRAHRLGLPCPWPRDAVVVCSFGDASLNHSTALGALNAAGWAAHQRLPVPVLFVCEDNGLGISVRTPSGWVEARARALPGLAWFQVDGTDLDRTCEVVEEAVAHCREKRSPAFLHLRCVRLWGHAGSDADAEYRDAAELAQAEAADPVLLAARRLLASGVLDRAALGAMLERLRARVRDASAQAVQRPKLRTRDAVMSAIAPSQPAKVAAEATRTGYGPPPPESERPRPLGQAIRMALHDLMQKHPELLVFGEDVAQKGGVYGVTAGLWSKFGPKRVFNTLLDEQTILGMALGAGASGLLPVPEIQFLAYLHNAEDQLRGEAATLSFFSSGQLKNPMVIRVAGLGYQKGFGGHFHNDDSLAVLRDLPGVIVAVPSRGDDAARMLRTCLAEAKVDGRVCVFVEPIALYPQRDLFEAGDGRWSFPLPPQGEAIPVGEVGVYEKRGGDPKVLVITYGNGVPMCLRVQRRLADKKIRTRVIDLRWIAPLPAAAILAHARQARRVLMVDECRKSGNVGEAIGALLLERKDATPERYARIAAADSFVPLAEAANLVLPSEEEIFDAAMELGR